MRGGQKFQVPRKLPTISSAIQAKLRPARVARLATLDARNRPHLVPVCFVYEDGVFYSAVDRKPKQVTADKLVRVRNIRKTSQVALLIDQYDEDWRQLWYVLVRGTARLIPESAEKERAKAIRRLKAKYSQYAAGMLDDDAPVIRITPERVKAWGKL